MSEQVLEQPAQGPAPLAGPRSARPKGPVRSYLDSLEGSSRDSLGTAAGDPCCCGGSSSSSRRSTVRISCPTRRCSRSRSRWPSSGVVTVAQSLVTISGGILDLSIPTALILPAWVIVTLLGHGVNLVLVILVGLLTGAAWGALNALIIVFGKLNPLIVTLGTNFAGAADR